MDCWRLAKIFPISKILLVPPQLPSPSVCKSAKKMKLLINDFKKKAPGAEALAELDEKDGQY